MGSGISKHYGVYRELAALLVQAGQIGAVVGHYGNGPRRNMEGGVGEAGRSCILVSTDRG